MRVVHRSRKIKTSGRDFRSWPATHHRGGPGDEDGGTCPGPGASVRRDRRTSTTTSTTAPARTASPDTAAAAIGSNAYVVRRRGAGPPRSSSPASRRRSWSSRTRRVPSSTPRSRGPAAARRVPLPGGGQLAGRRLHRGRGRRCLGDSAHHSGEQGTRDDQGEDEPPAPSGRPVHRATLSTHARQLRAAASCRPVAGCVHARHFASGGRERTLRRSPIKAPRGHTIAHSMRKRGVGAGRHRPTASCGGRPSTGTYARRPSTQA